MPAATDEQKPATGSSETPALDSQQKDQVERRMFIPAKVVHEVVRRQGDEELERPASALAWSGLAAGLSMGMSLVAEGLLQAHLPDTQWRNLIVRAGYPLGFLLVVVGRQQLFTENTLTPIIPLMADRDLRTLWRVVRLWTVVLLANIVGAHIVSWALAATPAFRPEVKDAFLQLATDAVSVGFGTAVVKGIFAGWLIAMMVWMLGAVRSGEIAIILILTYIVGIGDLTHIIAGSVEALYLVWAGKLSWISCVTGYMLPALTGNVIGGVSLVAAVNHAQVVSGAGAHAGS